MARDYPPEPELKRVLEALREQYKAGEKILRGQEAILDWFKQAGMCSRSGTLSWRTVRSWNRHLGKLYWHEPGHGDARGGPVTTNYMLTAWCMSVGSGLEPRWHPSWRPVTADARARAARKQAVLHAVC